MVSLFPGKNIHFIIVFMAFVTVLGFQNCTDIQLSEKDSMLYNINKDIKVKALVEDISEHNLKLIHLNQQLSLDNNSRILSLMVLVAKERRKALEKLKVSPENIMSSSLSEDQIESMPSEVKAYLESYRSFDGDFMHLMADTHRDEHEKFYLKLSNETYIEIHSSIKIKGFSTGAKVKMRGLYLPKNIDDEDSSQALILSDSTAIQPLTNEEESGESLPVLAAQAIPLGEKKLLVLLVNFADNAGDKPYTTDEVRSHIFGTVSDFIKEMSFGQTWFTGDVAGWYTLSNTSIGCDQWGISREANAAATAAGIDLTLYTHIMYAFPRNGCGWGGYALVGGDTTWMNGSVLSKFTSTHELGHNLGLNHSGALECGNSVIADGCSIKAYGDQIDVMGDPNPVHTNAVQKEKLGWLSEQQNNITVVDKSGTYKLEPYSAQQGSLPKALKIAKDANSWYYIEYRQPIGFDSILTGNLNIIDGLIIHYYKAGDPQPFLLDMNPASTTYSFQDWVDPALRFGSTYTDQESGISISAEYGNDQSATVTISLTPSQCVPSAPTLEITSNALQGVSAGTAVEYTMTLINNDSSVCTPKSFHFSSSEITGWAQGFSSQDLNLSPGQSAQTILTVISSANAVDGDYKITVLAASETTSASQNVIYKIQNSGINQNPIAASDTATVEANTSAIIDVLSNDSDPDGDMIAISSASASNGSVKIGAALTYTPYVGFVGSDTLTYSIEDGKGGVASAMVKIDIVDSTSPTITITSPSEGEAVRGIITIQASGTDNVAIERVEFKIGGTLLGVDTMSPYTSDLDTNQLANGNHKITVQAIDGSGNRSLLDEVNVNVNNVDSTPPAIAITSPADGEFVSARSTIIISASASDNVAVGQVSIYVNGSLVCTDTSYPYSCTFDIPGGKSKSYAIEALATDASKNTSSDYITVSTGDSTSTDGGGGKGNGKGGKK